MPDSALPPQVRFLEEESAALAAWSDKIWTETADHFAAGEEIARKLGAHVEGGRVAMGFWTPELADSQVLDDDLFLEVLLPPEDFSLLMRHQVTEFQRVLLPIARTEEYCWGVYEGLPVGTRDHIGALYWLRYRDRDGAWRHIGDYLAHSLPFGAFAPAEIYDVEAMQANRADRAYGEALKRDRAGPDGIVRYDPPTNILQIHVGTATAGRSIAALDRMYQRIAYKMEHGQELAPAEEAYVGYDAVQLLPVEPIIEYESGPRFWQFDDRADDPRQNLVGVTAHRPDMTNWGYDIVISGSAAVNPVLLETDRPDELVDFAATLHNFPGKPIRLIFDVVFGHADNQAIALLNRHFFTGPNMYGQDLNYRNPMTRAIMLEMQRRKVNFGADGVRVDGAQDFKWWDAENHVLRHADDYLARMGDLDQEVCGVKFRPWMIYEDGRPWPQEDWELSSTYRSVIDKIPDSFQWGPLSFAHNTPFLYTFWVQKWWRIQEIIELGENWISGCANHDTLRRGTQVAPNKPYNRALGETPLEILDKAYDNPASNLLTYGMFPGVPMEFLNASMRASWGFIRNTDDRYAVKVVSEETVSINWQIDDPNYNMTGNFRRLKALGFLELEELKRYMRLLETAVFVTDYDLDAIVKLMASADPPLSGPEPTVDALKKVARAWMDDMHDYCNVSIYEENLSHAQTHFNLSLREFRRARPWLRRNLRPEAEVFDRIRPCDGAVVFYGLRQAPEDGEQLLFIANMEGEAKTIRPVDLPIRGLPRDGWENLIAAPGLHDARADQEITLHDSMGAIFRRTG